MSEYIGKRRLSANDGENEVVLQPPIGANITPEQKTKNENHETRIARVEKRHKSAVLL